MQTLPGVSTSWVRPKTLVYIGLWILWSTGVFMVWDKDRSVAMDNTTSVLIEKEQLPASITNAANTTEQDIVIPKPAAIPDPAPPVEKPAVTSVAPTSRTSDTDEPKSEKNTVHDYILKIYFKEGSSMWSDGQDVKAQVAKIQKDAAEKGEHLIIEAYDSKRDDTKASLELTKRRAWRIRSLFTDTNFRRKSLDWKYFGQQIPIDVEDDSSYQHEPIVFIKKQKE